MSRKAFPLEHKLLAAFAIGAIGLLVAVAFAAREGNAYLDADRRGDHLRDLDNAVTALVLSLRTAESAQRGYLLTGRERYLAPYANAISECAQRFAFARSLAGGDPPTRAALDGVRAHMGARLADLAQGIDVLRKDGFAAAQQTLSSDRGAEEMRAIRVAWEGIHADLSARANSSQLDVRDRFDATLRLLVAGAILALAMLVTVYTALAREIRHRRRLAERVRREADHDELTRLPNRRFFAQWLGYALAQARREGSTLGLLCIDIDGFKRVNDSGGHDAGDALLVDIARRFESLKRDSDVLARVGGDEFVLAAAGAADGRELAQLAQRLIDSLAAPPMSTPPVGASIGIAFFPDDAHDAPSLFASADAAMYAAKRAGKNRVVFHAVAGVGAPEGDVSATAR